MWRPKQKAPCEVPAQLHLSREDKGKLPIQFGSMTKAISREAKQASLPSPNLGAVTPGVNLALTGEVTDGVANTAPVPKGTSKVLSCKAGTEALTSASHLRYKAENKAPQCAKSEVIMTSLSKYSSTKSALRSELRDHP